jgi:hypothetical protein
MTPTLALCNDETWLLQYLPSTSLVASFAARVTFEKRRRNRRGTKGK